MARQLHASAADGACPVPDESDEEWFRAARLTPETRARPVAGLRATFLGIPKRRV